LSNVKLVFSFNYKDYEYNCQYLYIEKLHKYNEYLFNHRPKTRAINFIKLTLFYLFSGFNYSILYYSIFYTIYF